MTSLQVTADWSRFVDETDPEARFVVAEVDIDRLGLRAAYDAFTTPSPEPRASVKEYPKPPNKAARRPATK